MLLVDDHDVDGQVVGDGTGAAVFCPRHAEVLVTLRRTVVLTHGVPDPHRSMECQAQQERAQRPEW